MIKWELFASTEIFEIMCDGRVLQGMKHTSTGYLEEGDDILGFGVQNQPCTLSGSG